MLLGCRVVRGPDWKWHDQDGGDGHVGTIINLTHFNDGRTLPTKTVLVCWDSGPVADYRVGLNGCYDLMVLDSSPAGVEFKDFTCDGCLQSNISGMRWHCAQCPNFDLCNVCYMNDIHDKTHKFERFDMSNDHSNGVNVGQRSSATKVQSKGLFPGAMVKRGRDWSFGSDNELSSMVGKVVGLTSCENIRRSAVIVQWGGLLETPQRVGYQGKVDVQTDNAGNGPSYYRAHLPVVVLPTTLLRLASSTGGQKLNEGDRVTIHLDVDTLKLMAAGHGGWVLGMEKTIGKVGKIAKVDEDGDVHIDFGLNTWVFHPEALVKVRDLRPGDKVRVVKDKELVMRYQDGHGGWNNSMQTALGNQGKVVDVDKDGDAVVNVGGQRWLFNAAALVLESKEEERQAPGVRTGTAGVEELLLNALLEGLEQGLTRTLDGTGVEQLVLASTLGNLDKVKEIIQKDKSLINQKTTGEKTALHVACHQGNPEITSFLLESGADKDIRDEGGYTALHHAAYGDKSGACVVIMLSANTNVNVTDMDKTKVTPLHLAIQQDNEKAVIALTQFRHCDVNLQDKVGDTPLHTAVLMGHTKTATTIIQNRHQILDPTLFNQKGFNVLHLACIKNDVGTANLLIDKYPGLVDMVKEDGFSALHLAALNNRVDIAKLLILSGHCEIDLRNKEGRTALSIAVGESLKSMIEMLLEHGVNINAEDKDGDIPLHMAVMKHCMGFLGIDLAVLLGKSQVQDGKNNVNFAIALFLVLHGANTNHRNHQGQTPVDLCIDKQLKDMLVQYSRSPRNNVPGTAAPQPPSTPQRPPCRPSSTTPPSTASSSTPSPSTTSPGTLPTLPPPPSGFPVKPTKCPPAIPKPETISALIPPLTGLQFAPKPSWIKSDAAANLPGDKPGPSSREDVPPSLAQAELNNENVNSGVVGKRSNNQMSSEIQASAQQPVSQAHNSNIQGDQMKRCCYCEQEQAVVIFEPCKHKVVCQPCSFRVKVCPECKVKVENKVAPGEEPYKSLTDFKKNYEEKLKELRKECSELERLALCQICMDRPSNVVFNICRHKCCEICCHRIRKCHVCQRDITMDEKITTFQ